MSIGSLSCSYSYGGWRQAKLTGIEPAEHVDQRDARQHRPEVVAIGARGSGSRRTSAGRASGTSARNTAGRKYTPGSSSAFIAVGKPLRVDPRRADQLERPRGARVLPRASRPRTARCPDRRSPCRASACWATASPTAVRVWSAVHRRAATVPSATTSSVAPMPKCSLKSRASSPMVIPWRIGIGNWPTNDSKPGNERRALDVGAANRIRPVADDDRDAVARRGAQAVRHRVDVGVDPRADVLQVDDQHIEAPAASRPSARGSRCRANTPAPAAPGRPGAAFRSCCPARPTGSRAAGRKSPPVRRPARRSAGRRRGGRRGRPRRGCRRCRRGRRAGDGIRAAHRTRDALNQTATPAIRPLSNVDRPKVPNRCRR